VLAKIDSGKYVTKIFDLTLVGRCCLEGHQQSNCKTLQLEPSD
jgi:hypothetical protein